MVTRNDLLGMRHSRTLLKGPFGSGKTFQAVSEAARYARAGKTVLYLDMKERSAADELLRLPDDVLVNINYQNIVKFMDLLALSRANVTSPLASLVVVDAVHHIVMSSRDDYAAVIRERGYRYNNKDDKVSIEDPEHFYLTGFEYGRPNSWMNELCMNLVASDCDTVMTIDPSVISKKDGETKLSIEGLFDTVIEMGWTSSGVGKIVYTYRLQKARGNLIEDRSIKTVPIVMDPSSNLEEPTIIATIHALSGKPIPY